MTWLSNMDARVVLVAWMLVCLGLFYWAWQLLRVPGKKFVGRAIVTGNELEFYHRLRRALPQYDVLPQVAMSAVMDVGVPETHPQYWPLRNAFAMKTIDYVVCTRKDLKLVAVVELDDKTHDVKREKDAARDAMLATAGILTIRWDCRRKPSERQIAERFAQLQG